jgi:hypothetical protein
MHGNRPRHRLHDMRRSGTGSTAHINPAAASASNAGAQGDASADFDRDLDILAAILRSAPDADESAFDRLERIRRALSLPIVPPVGGGMVMVPREPTYAMLCADGCDKHGPKDD